jgi:hypothetical protein
VNAVGRALASQGLVARARGQCPRCAGLKIVSRLLAGPPAVTSDRPPADRPWTWEGNIQAAIVRRLSENGYHILRVSDTDTREQGKDIVARTADGQQCWISVKGLPASSVNVQARHWFAGALFDMILYRQENPDVRIGIGLPDGVPTYLNLARRVTWFKQASGFTFYWVSEDGRVREE